MNGIMSLRRQKKKLINSLLPLFEKALKSTLVEYYLKCGKPYCRCKKGGAKHGPYLYLSTTEDSKTRLYKVPKGLEKKVKEGVEVYNEIWKRFCSLCDINRQILWSEIKKELKDEQKSS